MLWIYLIASYFLGNIMFGYLVSKFIYQEDIRQQGSRNVGARNAGRLYGKKAFILIFIGDALKGIIVVIGGKFLNFPDSIQLLALGMATLGHINPLFFRFKGGKGISTFIGGIILFEPINAIVIIISFLLTFPFTRSFTFSGLGALLMIPIYLFIKGYSWITCIILICIIILLLIAHMENIKERLKPTDK